MKKLRLFYNETKDQAVPFALPALRSYKQNLLFPEDQFRKADTSQYPSFETTENSRTPSKQKSLRSNKPNRHISPARIPTTPLRPMAANRNISKNPSVHSNPLKKPSLASRSVEPVRPLKQTHPNIPQTIPEHLSKPNRPPMRPTNSKTVENPLESPKIQPKKAVSTPKNSQKSPIRSLENTEKVTKIKPESAKASIRPTKIRSKQALPMTAIPEKRRSNSITSAKSIRSHLKSPRINTHSSGSRFDEFSIPEFPNKNPSRLSAARSLTRKRPRKNKKSSYFEFDPMYFRMSDLSIYPLF